MRFAFNIRKQSDCSTILYMNEIHLQETISGVVLVKSPSDFKHDGIVLTIEGCVNLTLSSKTVGVFEALYNSAKVRKRREEILSWGGKKKYFHARQSII